MIKLHYGTDKERGELANNYVKYFPYLSQMDTDWKELRSDYIAVDTSFNCLPKDIKKLLTLDYVELVEIYEKCTSFKNIIPDDLIKRSKLLFSYDRYEYNGKIGYRLSGKISRFFMNHAKEMQIYTCHYCDMAYINAYPNGKRKKSNHFDLDHVLDKGRCPIIALSFFNLVPVCPVCNERIKSTHQITNDHDERITLSPTNPDYDFDGCVTIWVDNKKGSCSTFGYEKRIDDYEIKFDTTKNPIYQKEVDFFRLKQRYDYHKCEALRLMDLKERYTDSKIVEMARLIMGDNASKKVSSAGVTVINQIKKDIFADEFISVHHRTFDKLRRDILK